MSGLGVSVISAFLYRLAALTNSIPTLHKKSSIIGIVFLHLFYAAPLGVCIVYSCVYDYDAILEVIKRVKLIRFITDQSI